MYPRVSVIILNWNGTKDTIECLQSFKAVTYDNYQLILVDNGSEPEKLQELKDWCNLNYKRIYNYTRIQTENKEYVCNLTSDIYEKNSLIIIENGENLGFAAGNNVAIRFSLALGYEYTLLLNNDTTVEANFLTELMDLMLHNNTIVALTPQIRYFHDKERIWNCGGRIAWYANRIYNYANKKYSVLPKVDFIKIEFITGCALLFQPLRTGILSELFFFGEEDVEFSLRLKKNKLGVACALKSIIYHKVGGSISHYKNQINKIFLFYASRLINLKYYYKGYKMFIIKFIYKIYILFFLIYRQRLGLIKSLKFLCRLIKFVQKNKQIRKEQFIQIINYKI